jgi:putative membrane protein
MKKVCTGILSIAMVLAAGCGTTATNANDSTTAMTSSTMATNTTMAAPDIAGIMTVANMGEVQQAQAALPNLTTSPARDFAEMMINEHTNALNEARTVFAANSIVPRESNPNAVSLRGQSDRLVTSLRSGSSVDRMYMQAQVDVHQKLLNMLDTQLIPASRGDLLDLLQKQRTSVAMHLDRARQIVGGLQ